jgi:hypothetical protein
MLLVKNWQATSALQHAEWGMQILQESLSWVQYMTKYKESRGDMLLTSVLLCKLRAYIVGLNQISNKYLPVLSKDAN